MKPARWLSLTLLVGAALTAASCGDRTATDPTALPATGKLASMQQTGLPQCRPQRSKSTSKKIGAAGGVIDLGSYVLTVPPQALTKTVTISASIPQSSTVDVVVFHPDGLVFRVPASLRIDYSNCPLTSSAAELQVAVVNDSLQILYSLPSVVDTVSKTITGTVPHFTNYAVAW